MSMYWKHRLQALLVQGRPVVRMAVAAVRGSAPREPGATLLYWVDADGRTRSDGSIGGGHLEWRALQIAQHLLDEVGAHPRCERFTLGATLGQCCGGVVELFWERFDPSMADNPLPATGWRWSPLEAAGRMRSDDPGIDGRAAIVARDGCRYFVEHLADDATELYLYGAGHVGQALQRVLAGLPFRIHWIDSRPGMPEPVMQSEAPEADAARAPDGAWHLVMTHSHDEDFRICEALIARGRFGFLGVIGSGTKQARFRSRLLQRGHDPRQVARMQSPIGVAGIAAKLPAAIAVAVAAQLLQLREAGHAQTLFDTGTRNA